MALLKRRRKPPARKPFANAESIRSSKNALATLDRDERRDQLDVVEGTSRRRTSSRESLTAAGFRITRQDMDSLRRLIQPWQSRSFAYYDLLGEIKFAAQFYSRALSQLRLYPAIKDEHGDWVEDSSPEAKKLLERVQDPGGGMAGLLDQYGRLMFLTGEAYLLVSEDPDNPGLEMWEMLSTDECRVSGNVVTRYKAPSLSAEEYHLQPDDKDEWKIEGTQVAVFRLWQRHPRYSMLADATMQGVLDICEELLIMTRAVRSRARSRLAGSGILIVDESITTVPLEAGHDEDPEEDPFLADLTQAMTTPIVNEGSASAFVPLVARLKVPEGKSAKDMIAHIQIVDPTQLYPETGLRMECIDRMAIGLDMPPEALKGNTDANHWTGWLIDEQTWKHHLQPKAGQLVDDLTAAYYRPACRAAGIQDWANRAVRYDATAIINHPDKAKDAKDLHARIAIGDKALREATGFDEEDAPTKEEQARWVGILTRDGSLAWDGIPNVKAGGIEPEPGLIVSGKGEAGTPTGATTGAEVEPGPPPLPRGETEQPITGSAAEAYKVLAAADLALLRARELAGNRLRSLARKDKECGDLIDGVKPTAVASTLGHERIATLCRQSNRELVAGCSQLVVDALRLWGIKGDLAALIADNVEQHAALTLYEPVASMPPSFRNYVGALLNER